MLMDSASEIPNKMVNDFNCTLRPAVPTDAESIVTTIRTVFDTKLLGCFIYGCPGVTRYVAEQIAILDRGGGTHFAVAEINGEFAAFAELRRLTNRLFLNYIAVKPDFQKLGIGYRVLSRGISLTGTENCQEMALDVLENNDIPRTWYERLGFRQEGVTYWWNLPLKAGVPSPVRLERYAEAQAMQREYGFSQFDICVDNQRYSIGRLGDNLYRITESNALLSPSLMHILHELGPKRKILLLSADWVPPQTECKPVARTLRMAVDLTCLQQQLRK